MWKQSQRKLGKEPANTRNMPLPLGIRRLRDIEDKGNER